MSLELHLTGGTSLRLPLLWDQLSYHKVAEDEQGELGVPRPEDAEACIGKPHSTERVSLADLPCSPSSHFTSSDRVHHFLN